MPDVQEVFRMSTQKVRPDPGALERQFRQQRRRTAGRKIGAFAVVAAIVVAAVVFAIASRLEDDGQTIGTPPGGFPVVDSDATLDLLTGKVQALPAPIAGSEGQTTGYALSPDGSTLAFARPVDDGTTQVFVADLDGTDVAQVTNDAVGAGFPAWTPDGGSIAYEGYGDGDVRNIFLVHVQTGETRQVTHSDSDVFGTHVSPDASVLYGGVRSGLRSVPLEGGRPTLLAGGGGDRGDAGGGSVSPDGRLLSFPFGDVGVRGTLWVANADGSEARELVDEFLDCSRSGGWSPDSSTLACTDLANVLLVDVRTGATTAVAEARGDLGEAPIWLDDHTLIVDV